MKHLFDEPRIHDPIITGIFLILGTLLAFFLNHITSSIIDVSSIYILSVVVIARMTSRYIYNFSESSALIL